MIKALFAENLKPQLIPDNETGNLYIEISVGKESLRRLLPRLETPADAQAYIDKLVPDMAKELYKRIRKKKIKRGRLKSEDQGK